MTKFPIFNEIFGNFLHTPPVSRPLQFDDKMAMISPEKKAETAIKSYDSFMSRCT